MYLWCSPPDLYICIFLCFSGFYGFPFTLFEWPGFFSDTEVLLLTWYSKFTMAQINITELGITYFILHTKSQVKTTHSPSQAHWHKCTQLRLLTWTRPTKLFGSQAWRNYAVLSASVCWDILYILHTYMKSQGSSTLHLPWLLPPQSTWIQHGFT